MLREAMREGCRGLSTGRGYLPGRHADTAEIVALARELRRSGGLYTSHVKSESDGLLDAVREVIDIGRRSGVKVQVSHMKAIGPSHFGRIAEALGLLERARESGVDVNCDAYPYDFTQVSMLRHSQFGFGPSSDPAHVMASLRDEGWRARLRKRLERGKSGFSQRADRLVLVAVRGRADLSMVDLATAASREGREPLDFALDLLLGAELDVRVAARMSEDDVRQVLKHPLTMVGTDAFAIDGDPPTGLPLHPRHYGTFPRVLGHYARDVGLFGLPEAVYKMTGLPARKLGLSDRGTVAEGNWADLVVFDPRRVLDLATAAEPARRPAGIKAVLVNGEVAYQDGRPTGALGGKVLLRS
jgi:N-acyl-D-aspartate/D-glutamate deacylase